MSQNNIKVFISHSSADEQIVSCFTEILRIKQKLDPSQILCTSLPKYSIPTGHDQNSYLRATLNSASLVIGIITKKSIESSFVQFELGARWFAEKPLIPLICDPLGTSLLRDPIKSLHAANCCTIEGAKKAFRDIESRLPAIDCTWPSFENELKKFVKICDGSFAYLD